MTSPTILPVVQRTPEWLDARKNGIGSSEAAAAVGVSPWESRLTLWARKLGIVSPEPANIAMQVGTELEPLIARLYTEATGVQLRRANQLRQHARHPFMLASIDRRAGRKPVELKWSGRATGYGEPGTDEVPDEVLVQVLHQLEVLDEDEADVALLTPSRDELAIYHVRRERPAVERIVELEAELWHHVETRTEPPLDASESTRRTLREMYPADDGTVLDATPELAELVGQLAAARAAKKAAEAQESEVAIALMAAIGEASGIAGLLAAKKNRDSERTDWPAVARDYRALLEGQVDTEKLEFIRSMHTETARGNRPLRLLSKGD